ncbi:hypothetical protein [Rubrolithibacter danxiaensis]|uniref:hypothetical protein n=1 Tax=Rubrolithibacter danxiaensis TaxID=3390805 RepID=UPI003BF88D2B
MFDQILGLVKDHIGGNPQIANTIPNGQHEAVNHEIAEHITQGLKSQANSEEGAGNLLSKLAGGISSGSPVTSAIEEGLLGTLGSKFGLPPAATGAIAAALPGILQKFAHKANDPNDASVNKESVLGSLSGGLGGLF